MDPGSPPKSIQGNKQCLPNSGNGNGLFQCKLTALINPGGGKQPLGYPVEKRFHYNDGRIYNHERHLAINVCVSRCIWP